MKTTTTTTYQSDKITRGIRLSEKFRGVREGSAAPALTSAVTLEPDR